MATTLTDGRLCEAIRGLRLLTVSIVVSLLVACGGGDDPSRSPTTAADVRQRALAASEAEVPQALAVVGLTKIKEVRVGRTTFDYAFRVVVQNSGQARGDVVVRAIEVPTGSTLIRSEVTLSVIEAGQMLEAQGTISIRHNRVYPFNVAALKWSITSTRAVSISGFVIDDPVVDASVQVTSLLTLGTIATANTDQTGFYSTPSLPQSLLGGGYSVVAAGGTVNGKAFSGTLKAVYGLPSDYANSHITLLTTAATRAAESTAIAPADQPAAMEAIGNSAAARGQYPANWKDPSVALAYGQENSAAVALDGVDKYTTRAAVGLTLSAPPVTGASSCRNSSIAGEFVCSARIGAPGGQVFRDKEGGGVELVATIPPMVYASGAVEVSLTFSESGNALLFDVSAARDLNAGPMNETATRLVDGTLFGVSPSFQLPPADFVGDLNVEDQCLARSHGNTPDCLTRASNIRPANFVIDKGVWHRVPNGASYTHLSTSTTGRVYRRFGSNLFGSASRSQDRTAVIFVHGYQSRGGVEVGQFGGGEGTWGAFPRLVGQLNSPSNSDQQLFDRYEFHWRSNTSFYSAADDLAAAIRYVYTQSKSKRVHIVAHSFGGLLARVALQDLNANAGDLGEMVQSLTTLGTPHAGIFDASLHGDPTRPLPPIPLPQGWDAILGNLCGQLTCYEGGLLAGVKDWVLDAHKRSPRASGRYGPGVLGGVVADLKTSVGALKSHQKILALIGVGFGSGGKLRSNNVASGDQLITIGGQRLNPEAAECSSQSPFLFSKALGSATASERVLGLLPGYCVRALGELDSTVLTEYTQQTSPLVGLDAYYGYAHTATMGAVGTPSVVEANEAEIPVECVDVVACKHDSWVSTRALLLSFHGGPTSPDFDTGSATSGAKLNDSGIGALQCIIQGSDLLASCASDEAFALSDGQDGMVGRDVANSDASDGRLGFSFSKLPKSSGDLYETTECLRDNVTSLVWEGKPIDGPRAGSILYKNGGVGSSPDITTHIAYVNGQQLCGYADWRLPTSLELQSIVDYGSGMPAIDSSWFPNTLVTHGYWTTEQSQLPGFSRWFVYFNYGSVGFTSGGRVTGPVRLVRGNSPIGSSRFEFETIPYELDGPNNIAVDTLTGLKWRRCSEGQTWDGLTCIGSATEFFTPQAALAYAKGRGGWRVPNIKEISSIHDKTQLAPAIDPVVFPGVFVSANSRLSRYWSSTPFAGEAGFPGYWYVQYNNERQVVGTHWDSADRSRLRMVR